MPAKMLKDYLDSNKVKYTALSHSVAYTAQEIASIAHIPGKELAKTVMVKLDGQMAMAVLPASFKVDLELLQSVSRSNTAESVWAYNFGKGRVCFMAPGHMIAVLWNPEYIKMQKNAARWLLHQA